MASTLGSASDFTEIVNKDDVFIAIMGLTGSGKSSLIASYTNQDVPIGHNLSSYTTTVTMYSVDHRDATGRTRRVHLIDTPGFDDSRRTDAEVLQELVFWLTQSYHNGMFLDGIVYLHNITVPRFEGPHKRARDIFEALIGSQNHQCVYLATTFWDEAKTRDNLDLAFAHYDQLRKESWKTLISNGAHLHPEPEDEEIDADPYGWVHVIIEHIVQKSNKHILQIQTEMRAPNTKLADTLAGQIASDSWKTDVARVGQLPQLQKSKDQVIREWKALLQEDMVKLKQDISRLNKEIDQVNATPLSYNGPSHEYLQELRSQKNSLQQQQMLKLTSYGMYVNTAAAAFGLAGAVFAGIAACTVM